MGCLSWGGYALSFEEMRKLARVRHPSSLKGAGLLLKQGKAAVLRRYPFMLILKAVHVEAESAPLRLKVDPGSKTTGT